MWLGLILAFAVAMVFFWLAISISKGKINSYYHRINVKEEDKKNYCKLFSKGLYIIGVGCLLSSFFIFRAKVLGFIVSMFLGIVLGYIY